MAEKNEDLSQVEFTRRAIKQLKDSSEKGIHSEYSGFNDAFRNINMPDDYPAKTMHIPKDEAQMSEPRRVTEGSEYPRTEEGEETIPVTVKKHGFEVAITWEATEFSVFDVIARQTEKAARRFNEYINRLAFEVIDDPLVLRNVNLHFLDVLCCDPFDVSCPTCILQSVYCLLVGQV